MARRIVIGIAAIGALWQAGVVGASLDAPSSGGAVELVDPDSRQPIYSGDSNTPFVLRVPPGAVCPGDSANDDWRVQSFLIPVTDDPATIQYGVIGAEGDGQYAIYSLQTRPYVDTLLEQNSAAGLPGRIPESVPLSFGVFPAGTLTEDRYRVGLACTFFRETAVYWDTEIELTSAPEVEPGQFRWTVAGAPVIEESDGGSSAVYVVLAVAAVVALGALVLRARRRSRPEQNQTILDKESV
jgi:MYXO-CTERM domain-containing protein